MSLEVGSGQRQLGIFKGLKKSRKHHVLKINSLFFFEQMDLKNSRMWRGMSLSMKTSEEAFQSYGRKSLRKR